MCTPMAGVIQMAGVAMHSRCSVLRYHFRFQRQLTGCMAGQLLPSAGSSETFRVTCGALFYFVLCNPTWVTRGEPEPKPE